MIHLDSVEKSAQRISDYLHDPSAFGDKLNANRRERLTTLHKSLIDSANILASKLGISTDPTIESMCADIQRIKDILGNRPDRSDTDLKIQESKSESKLYSDRYPKLTKKGCGFVYMMYCNAILDGANYDYDNPYAKEFADLVFDMFEFRFKSSSPTKARYNAFQIAVSIEQMFIAFMASKLLGRQASFESRYRYWKSGVESGGIKSLVPALVLDYSEIALDVFSESDRNEIINTWRDLLEGPYATIRRTVIRDEKVKNAFLPSNPFKVWDEWNLREDVAAAL